MSITGHFERLASDYEHYRIQRFRPVKTCSLCGEAPWLDPSPAIPASPSRNLVSNTRRISDRLNRLIRPLAEIPTDSHGLADNRHDHRDVQAAATSTGEIREQATACG